MGLAHGVLRDLGDIVDGGGKWAACGLADDDGAERGPVREAIGHGEVLLGEFAAIDLINHLLLAKRAEGPAVALDEDFHDDAGRRGGGCEKSHS
jgi:hypothetical protein